MTGKAVTPGRKNAAGDRRKTMPRAATRTSKKTASARAQMPTALKPATRKAPPRKAVALTPSGQKAASARRPAANKPEVTLRPDVDELERDLDTARKDAAALRIEDDDLDWLTEEDDPRKQIVEDDEEWDTHHDEW